MPNSRNPVRTGKPVPACRLAAPLDSIAPRRSGVRVPLAPLARIRRLDHTLLAVASACAALGAHSAVAHALPPCEAAPCASDTGRPVAILSYYRGRDLTELIDAEL